MTFVFLQYPPLFILLLAALLLTLAAAVLKRFTLIPAFGAGIAVVAMLLLGLYYAVPLPELLGLLLLPLLLSGFFLRKGGRP